MTLPLRSPRVPTGSGAQSSGLSRVLASGVMEPTSGLGARIARHAGFVAVNVAAVAAWTALVQQNVPPTHGAPVSRFILPMASIAAAAFAVMHPILLRIRSSAGRGAVLLGFYGLAVTAFGFYVGAACFHARSGRELVGIAWVVAFACHLWATPGLGLIALMNKALGRWLCPRSPALGR